jgi:hypothetical protein
MACPEMSAQDLSFGSDITRKDSLQEVIITGMRPVYNLSSPAPVQVMNGRALERFKTQSVADAVRYFAGVQMKDYGGIGGLKTVDIRSMGTTQMAIFYDGIQLGNAQNGQIDLGRFSLDNMEAVSLYNGQKSEIFQSAKDYGSAGSIYLTSIQPKFAEGEKTKIRVAHKIASYEMIDFPLSYGLTNPSVLWQQKLSDAASGTISAEWLHTNGRYRFRDRVYNNNGSVAYDTTAIRENSDVNAFRIEAGTNGTIENGEWNAKAYYYHSERGLPGPTVRNVFWRNQRLWDRNFFLQGGSRKKMGKRYDFKLNAKYAHDYTHYIDKDEASLWVNNTYRQQEAYLSVINKYDILPCWSISLPVDFQYNKLYNFSYPQRYTMLAAFASALSLDWVKLQASLLSSMVRETVKAAPLPPDRNEWSPAVFASFKPFRKEDLHIRAFYKKAFRMPTFNDLYYTIIMSSFLKPEIAVQYDVGITCGKRFEHAVFRSITFQADAYHNQITDKLIATPTNRQFRWEMTNLGRVEIFGADVAAHAMFRVSSLFLKTSLNYTWQRAEDRTNPAQPNYGQQIPYTPWHSGSVIVNAEYKNWGLNYSFIYTGERYNNQENIRRNHVQPWYTSDISLFREFEHRTAKYKISAEVNNLLNQYYAVIENYPMPGRNYKLVMSVEF